MPKPNLENYNPIVHVPLCFSKDSNRMALVTCTDCGEDTYCWNYGSAWCSCEWLCMACSLVKKFARFNDYDEVVREYKGK